MAPRTGYIDESNDTMLQGSETNARNRASQTPSTSGTGTGGTSTTNDTSNGMEAYTGFASRYAPGALMNTIYDNPWYVLPDVFKGINTNSPGYQYLRDFGGDPLSLFNIMNGGSGQLDGGEGAYTNFLAEMYKNLGTPGGKGFSATELLGAIFNADSESSLGNILGAGDMNTQIRTLFNLLRDASEVSMNPLAARGYQSAVAQQGDRYGNEMLISGAGDTTSPVEWMRQNAPWLTVR